MNQKTLTIAAFFTACILIAGSLTLATSITAFGQPMMPDKHGDYKKKDKDGKADKDGKDGDTSETNTPQKLHQENVGSGYSTNANCGQNTINSIAVGVCPDASIGLSFD
jgi:hypothetical protein